MASSEPISIRGVTLAVALATLPLVRGVTLHEEPGVSFGIFRLTTFHYFDLFLIVAVGAALLEWRKLGWPRSSLALLAAAIPAALLLSLILHPSPRGLSMVLRWGAGGVLFASMTTMTRDELRRYVALPMLVMATLQGLVAWAQLATDSAAGLASLGGAAPRVVNGVARAAGTFAVPYLLAAYALVALGVAIVLRPRPTPTVWLVLMAGSVFPVAVTFSRAAALGLILGGGIALVGSRADRTLRPVVVAVAVGFAIPALLNLGSWTDRVDGASASGGAESVRLELIDQAVTLVEEHPLLGVGTARYSLALEDRFDVDERTAHPVHLAPLLFLVEVGLVLGLAVMAIGAKALYDVARSSAEARVLLLLPAGFVLFDHLNLTHPIGPVLTMVWLAVLAAAVRKEADIRA